MNSIDLDKKIKDLREQAEDIRYHLDMDISYSVWDAELLEECADIIEELKGPSKITKGTWIRKPDLDDESYGCYCSLCETWFNNRDWFVTYKYCPNCGNKMDGKIVMENDYLGDE